MIITDAQVHVWEAPSPERPWPDGSQQATAFVAVPGARAHRVEPIGSTEMVEMMDTAGVHRAIIVPPSPAGDSNLCALEAAAQYPDRFRVMGRFNPLQPDASAALSTWLTQPYMAGIRMTFHRSPWDAWLDDGSLDPFWAACERFQIPLMLLMPARLDALDRVAQRYPALTLIIDHLGLHSHHRDADCASSFQQLLSLARHENVSVKASAVPCYTQEAYPFEGFKPYLRAVYESFGPQRMFWGSDVSRLPCSYRDAVTHFTQTLDFISPADLPWVMGGALSRWLRWD
ncbi:MAG: amidohydrolase [Limnohabitans sp.]|jgi:predicted TIM-barrel fold metal-dependent hydrolase|nr:amidohydrolase [Limnohabitans sp.]